MKSKNNLLHKELCPKSDQFDIEWMLANEMGPNAVWLAEILAERMKLKKAVRLLDLGCGRGMTSVFLAKTPQGILNQLLALMLTSILELMTCISDISLDFCKMADK